MDGPRLFRRPRPTSVVRVPAASAEACMWHVRLVGVYLLAWRSCFRRSERQTDGRFDGWLAREETRRRSRKQTPPLPSSFIRSSPVNRDRRLDLRSDRSITLGTTGRDGLGRASVERHAPPRPRGLQGPTSWASSQEASPNGRKKKSRSCVFVDKNLLYVRNELSAVEESTICMSLPPVATLWAPMYAR
jgi:hypothetical protein